jgi:hypothetical protein
VRPPAPGPASQRMARETVDSYQRLDVREEAREARFSPLRPSLDLCRAGSGTFLTASSSSMSAATSAVRVLGFFARSAVTAVGCSSRSVARSPAGAATGSSTPLNAKARRTAPTVAATALRRGTASRDTHGDSPRSLRACGGAHSSGWWPRSERPKPRGSPARHWCGSCCGANASLPCTWPTTGCRRRRSRSVEAQATPAR